MIEVYTPPGSLVVPLLGVTYRILNRNHKRELLRSLWVRTITRGSSMCILGTMSLNPKP